MVVAIERPIIQFFGCDLSCNSALIVLLYFQKSIIALCLSVFLSALFVLIAFILS